MPVRYIDHLPRSADLVVIGGGVLGAATAFYAVRAGFDVVVLERRPALCTLTTPASTGAFRLQFDNPEEIEVVRESVDMFLAFNEVTSQDEYQLNVKQQGYLWVTLHEERAERARQLVERQRSWGLEDVEWLDEAQIRDAFPYLTPRAIAARFRRGDGFLDPRALTMGFVAGSRAGVVVDCGAIGFEVDGEGLAGVRTGRGTISTRAAVIACGPFTAKLALTAGVDLPVRMVARQKIVFPHLPEVPAWAPMTIDDDTGAHWRPFLRGAAVLFTDPDTPPGPPLENVPVDHDGVFRVLRPEGDVSVARISPFWRDVWSRNAHTWIVHTGQYTMSPDKRPLAGETEVPGLFVNSGDSGHGVMTSAAIARRLADIVAGSLPEERNPFRLSRAFEAREFDVL
jgi:sarcosine oxidase, subunit beta